MSDKDAPRLERKIGLAGSTLLSFNGVVGAGIFALPATLAVGFGVFSPWLFPLVAAGLLLVVIPFARSVAAFRDSGGPAIYGSVFGRVTGFELGWFYYVSKVAAFAANATVLTAYLARWWPGADQGSWRSAIVITVCAGFAAVNITGVRKAIALLGGLTLIKALPLLIVAVAVIIMTFPPPAPGPLPLMTELEAGVLLVLYAFSGFENNVVPAGETKRPERVLPRGILATVAASTALYFLVQLAFVSALPEGGTDEKAPLIDLGRWLAGSAGAALLTLAAISSLAANLHGNLASTSRVTSGLAESGDLPRWFARVHRRFETPANSIAFMAVLAGALALSGSFVFLAAVSVLSRLLVYAVTIAALPRAPERPPLNALHWIGGAAGIAVCAWAAAQASADSWITLGALGAGGLLLYAISAIVRVRTG